MKICVVTGSRADYGMLEWPIKLIKADPFFEVEVWEITPRKFVDSSERDIPLNAALALRQTADHLYENKPDVVLLLGDRFEILSAAIAAHLQRIPIAHIGGGDVTEGSYDDAMRDAISRMAGIHFVTSTSAMARLTNMGYRNIHLVGSTGIDYIKHADWKRERPIAEPYVVVSYQAETIDGGNYWGSMCQTLPNVHKVFILPNPDRGSDKIIHDTKWFYRASANATIHDFLPHDEFLNLIYHCDEFIGNSSAMLYEAPELGVKTRMIGKRQRGRVIPWGDGNASERIVKVLKYTNL